MSEAPFIHEKALVESGVKIGPGTRVWAFAHLLPGVAIGADCNICDGVFIETGVTVGDRVTIKCGVQLWDGVQLEDDVFVGPNATFTNNPFPRSRMYLSEHPKTIVEKGASIGANATILPGLRIGAGAMVGAGAVVTRNVPPGAVVVGNPAREMPLATAADTDRARKSSVADCRTIRLRSYSDERGTLLPVEGSTDIPFSPRRLFMISGVPDGASRGAHANLLSDQFIVPVVGALTVKLFDGEAQSEFRLDRRDEGLLVPATIWNDLSDFSGDNRTLVLASHPYDEAQYIRNRDAYAELRRGEAR